MSHDSMILVIENSDKVLTTNLTKVMPFLTSNLFYSSKTCLDLWFSITGRAEIVSRLSHHCQGIQDPSYHRRMSAGLLTTRCRNRFMLSTTCFVPIPSLELSLVS